MSVFVKKEELKFKCDVFFFDLVFSLVDEVMLDILFENVFEFDLESAFYVYLERKYCFVFLGDGYFEFFILEGYFFCLVFSGGGVFITVIVFGRDFRIVLSGSCIVVVFIVVYLDSIYSVEFR